LLLRIGPPIGRGRFIPGRCGKESDFAALQHFDAVRRKIAISLVHGSIIKVARKLLHVEEPHQTAGLKSPPKG
jgi:hypothetical protein